MGAGHSWGVFRTLVMVAGLLGLLGKSAGAAGVPPATALVQQALASEVRGDNAQRQALLEEALQETPDNAAAHWHAGQVLVDGAWRTPHEVERLAQQDARLEQYRELRGTAPTTAEGQAALARWCRKNHLDDEQRIHWMAVLKDQPNHAEALQALNRLGLRLFEGRLRTAGEIAELRNQKHSWQQELKVWRPRVEEWRRAVDVPGGSMPADVREKIRRVSSRVEMQALNQAIWQAARKGPGGARLKLGLVETLADNPSSVAAEALVFHALDAGTGPVWEAAMAGLKRHRLDQYVPLLLAGLRGEMEGGLGFDVTADGRLVSHESRFQEGALTDAQGGITSAPSHNRAPLIVNATLATRENMARAQQEALRDSRERAEAAAEAQQASLEQANQQIAAWNARVVAVLRATTDQDLEPTIGAWWGWWRDYNGQASRDPSRKPSPEAARQSQWLTSLADPAAQEQAYRDQYSPASVTGSYQTSQMSPGVAVVTPVSVGSGPSIALECFAPETKVWTQTGLTAIEAIQMGDRVLSQDPESGELAYKPVLAVTVREDGQPMQVHVDGETLLTTDGHPFWRIGEGWQPAKALQPSDRLHTLSGAATVGDVRALTRAQARFPRAYNLVLQEFHTFFVGEHGVLVHDNTTRAATANLLPGLPPSADKYGVATQ